MTLKEIFEKNECDKAKHKYHMLYEEDFSPVQNDEINILEVGIWKGTSHQSWLDYFPNANVYGIDIFTRMKESDVSVLKNPRMHFGIADSTDKHAIRILLHAWKTKFDIIIDDGMHTPDANRKTFENLIPYLKDGGHYYIEDVWPLDVMHPSLWNHHWIKKKSEEFTLEKFEELKKTLTTHGIVFCHDFCHLSKMHDSYIMKVVKNV